MKLKQPELTNSLFLSVCLLLVCPACDDECSGLLISDMDRLYRIITEVTLTTPLPPPYKMLYRFENMTEGLKVNSTGRPPTHTHTHTHTLKLNKINFKKLILHVGLLSHQGFK